MVVDVAPVSSDVERPIVCSTARCLEFRCAGSHWSLANASLIPASQLHVCRACHAQGIDNQ